MPKLYPGIGSVAILVFKRNCYKREVMAGTYVRVLYDKRAMCVQNGNGARHRDMQGFRARSPPAIDDGQLPEEFFSALNDFGFEFTPAAFQYDHPAIPDFLKRAQIRNEVLMVNARSCTAFAFGDVAMNEVATRRFKG